MSDEAPTKSFDIPKAWVWRAYQKVRSNKGSAGIDDETIEMFDSNLSSSLYRIWNRMTSGSYMPPPVKLVEIPKRTGGVRKLGIPTVSDRVAQAVAKDFLEPILDPLFHVDSYGYRPGKSAKQAIAVTRRRCWQFAWVVEFDVKGAFDAIPHDLLMKAVAHHVSERWVLLYLRRWLQSPFVTANGSEVARKRGTPQGGVVGPLLMNLFMHYTFDCWMDRTHRDCPFARFSDDAVVHCRSKAQAEHLLMQVGERLQSCGLTLHSEKSKVVYRHDSNRRATHEHTQFEFLGFSFRPRCAPARDGSAFTSFQPAVSGTAQKRIRREIRSWHVRRRTESTISDLARQFNPALRGWIAYYGAFYKQELRSVFKHFNHKLLLWAQHKCGRLRRSGRRARKWLAGVCARMPDLFVHWAVFPADRPS